MEYYGNILCVSARELVENGIMSNDNYKIMTRRNKIDVVRKAHGTGNYALVAVDSLPEKYKAQVKELYPDGDKMRLTEWIKKNYERDQNAVVFFHSSSLAGLKLPERTIREYVINASVLNTCIKLYDRAAMANKLFGGRYNWDKMTEVIEGLREMYGHTLPASTLRFRKKVAEYKRDGYASLISGKFGNQSSRKVYEKTERLILSIAVLPNKPYNTSVHEMYNEFVCGELDVYDPETGELFNPDDFTDKKGDPQVLSETTINNYLNKPKNRILIDHILLTRTTYMHEVMPHVHRHAPEFSFSKISLDDRDLPRKMSDTKMRPKAYYAYDVTSQCVIGYAYSRNKNTDLVIDCFRNLFRLIERNGWGCPAQVEVENHLMSQWRDSFLKAGVMFPFVRFCAPTNSQEKYAEQMNGAKKRSIEHKNHSGIGRPFAKDRHYRTESKKVFDDKNNTYEENEYFSFEQLVTEDIRDINEFNNSLHPNQKKYPGKTRWEVLCENMNPTLQPMDRSIWARYIGDHIRTSVRRNSYCRVDGTDWWLSRTEVIENLAPNDWNVDAYCLRDTEGRVSDVWIYQNDMLLDQLQNVGTFNTADAEKTDVDQDVYVEQQKKIAHFNGYVKKNEIKRVGISEKMEEKETDTIENLTVSTAISEPAEHKKDNVFSENYAASALDDL